jgi:hypothetical protein
MRKRIMRYWTILLSLALVAAALTACGGAQPTETDEDAAADYESDMLSTRYEGALDVSAQLALGTLQLEETEQAVTPEQAETLLPLWQALQGGGVTAEGEVNAVLKGVEGTMTEDQLAAITDMALTEEDMEAWMEEQGLGAGGGFPGTAGDPDARATRQAETGGEGMPSGEDMPAEAATRMTEFQSMSEEEREAMRATAQAEGGIGAGRGGPGAGGGAGGVGQARLLFRPLIQLLSERAGENGS